MIDDAGTAADRTVLLLSGPNLNLLGAREPEVYGSASLDQLVTSAIEEGRTQGLSIEHLQSNHEGELVDAIHLARGRAAGIIVNGGAFTHYSWALHDALASFEGPVIELHISNPGARDEFRRTSVITAVCTAVVAGLGGAGYPLAVRAMAGLLDSSG